MSLQPALKQLGKNKTKENKGKRMQTTLMITKKTLQELLDEENERKKLGFSNMFEFAVYEELLKVPKDKKNSKDFTKKISEGIRKEIELGVGKLKRVPRNNLV